jgi:hypothetical protein
MNLPTHLIINPLSDEPKRIVSAWRIWPTRQAAQFPLRKYK